MRFESCIEKDLTKLINEVSGCVMHAGRGTYFDDLFEFEV
jgi:hypothetical protein